MILDRFRVTGQAAVVTGAGRGIGAATAIALAQAGADVLISARTEDQLAKVAREIEAAGRRAVIVPADLSDLDAAAGLASAAAEAVPGDEAASPGGRVPVQCRDRAPADPGGGSLPAGGPGPGSGSGSGSEPGRGDQHLLGDGPGRGPRVPRLRHR